MLAHCTAVQVVDALPLTDSGADILNNEDEADIMERVVTRC